MTMNEQEKQAVDFFVTEVLGLQRADSIQTATLVFAKSRHTTEEMLRVAHRECESLAERRVTAQKENVFFLSQRKHLSVACNLLAQAIDHGLHATLGIDLKEGTLHFD